jgi:hypothetical protein
MIAALAGVGAYFADRWTDRRNAAQTASLSYIERYAADPVLEARMALYEFWLEQEDFLAFAAENRIPPDQYQYFVETRFDEYSRPDDIRRALIAMDSFFDELAFCRGASVCETETLDAYFCVEVSRHEAIYAAFYDVMRGDLGESGFGQGVEDYAAICAGAENNNAAR